MRILGLDIETAPNTAHVWSLWKQNIAINQIVNTGRVMCFAAKWVGEPEITFFSEKIHGHKRTIKAAHKLVSEAEAVLSYNGEKFDLPTLNREFLKYDLKPPRRTRTLIFSRSPSVGFGLHQTRWTILRGS